FAVQNRRPSASVVVKLAQGRTLSRGQIDGIVHLVAASVEGMDAETVTVVDETGRVLTQSAKDGEPGGGAGTSLEYQQGGERGLEARVESMLGAIVGRDKVIARVAATFDFARTERTEETYDPDKTVVRQSHAMKEESVGATPPAAVPAGAQANLTNEATAPK